MFTSGFFNSVNSDRKYNAEQMSAIFDGIINDGIFDSVGDHFQVTPAASGLGVSVGTGRAWLNSTWSYNDTAYPIALSAASSTLSRIDLICIKVDKSSNVRSNSIVRIEGTPATSPVEPTVTDDTTNEIYYHKLAAVTVAAGATSISAANITNYVGLAAGTPYVTGILSSTAVDELWSQWDGEFNDWWDDIKATLDDNIVTTILNKIDHITPKEATMNLYGFSHINPPPSGMEYKEYSTDAILNQISSLLNGDTISEHAALIDASNANSLTNTIYFSCGGYDYSIKTVQNSSNKWQLALFKKDANNAYNFERYIYSATWSNDHLQISNTPHFRIVGYSREVLNTYGILFIPIEYTPSSSTTRAVLQLYVNSNENASLISSYSNANAIVGGRYIKVTADINATHDDGYIRVYRYSDSGTSDGYKEFTVSSFNKDSNYTCSAAATIIGVVGSDIYIGYTYARGTSSTGRDHYSELLKVTINDTLSASTMTKLYSTTAAYSGSAWTTNGILFTASASSANIGDNDFTLMGDRIYAYAFDTSTGSPRSICLEFDLNGTVLSTAYRTAPIINIRPIAQNASTFYLLHATVKSIRAVPKSAVSLDLIFGDHNELEFSYNGTFSDLTFMALAGNLDASKICIIGSNMIDFQNRKVYRIASESYAFGIYNDYNSDGVLYSWTEYLCSQDGTIDSPMVLICERNTQSKYIYSAIQIDKSKIYLPRYKALA